MAVATAGSRALALARNQVAGSGHGKQLFRDVSGDGAPTTTMRSLRVRDGGSRP